jgi:hypothetical protein
MPLFGQSIEKLEENRDFRGLAKALNAFSPQRSADALKALIRLNDSKAIEPLISLLYASVTRSVRVEVFALLVRLSGLDAGPGGSEEEFMDTLLKSEEVAAALRGNSLAPNIYTLAVDTSRQMTDEFVQKVRSAAGIKK